MTGIHDTIKVPASDPSEQLHLIFTLYRRHFRNIVKCGISVGIYSRTYHDITFINTSKFLNSFSSYNLFGWSKFREKMAYYYGL